MNVPGVNVLGLALGLIAKQPVNLFRFAGNVGQSNGNDLPTYSPAVAIVGSCQGVNSKTKIDLGLDWNSEYVNLFTAASVATIDRGTGGDVFVYAGKYYHAQARTDWLQQDGWNEVLAVLIPPLAVGQIVAP